MSESVAHYFDLSSAEQAELLHGVAPVLGRRAEILEKDIWLCQVLGILFALPNRKPMAFKGGTSLSKVYQAIERFSEDIDVTIDYRSLVVDVPELAMLSNTQRRKLSDTLKKALIEHVTEELVPALREALTQALPMHHLDIEISDNAERLWLYYPSAVENTDAYLRPSVLIEFGGRNAALPQDMMTIVPDVTAHVPQLAFPSAQVVVLSPMRTFWEKATLIHVECHRPDLRVGAERLSRHWYDLARLADHEVG
ncbi:Nucleotidyl transferase AbiEii/AbiGii toxin family protein [Bordetella tumbae]|uniref:nucleotidyl transferase AbiEii/AbiGii toxin family protein n=1 Tax=Bordetella tumbae TaxID=1649139 RepID=UPI0039F03A9C